MMSQAGIDVTQFKAHSIRIASTLSAAKICVSIKKKNSINTANWSRKLTFQRLYCKPQEKILLPKQILEQDLFHALNIHCHVRSLTMV